MFPLNFYWTIVNSKCCVSFCGTVQCISYTYPYIHSFLDSFPIWVITEYWIEFPVLYSQRRQLHPTPVLLPGKSHGWRSLEGCTPRGRWGSDTTKRLHFHFSLSCIGEGNGNPLQCSCLENPRDGGTWWLPSMGSHRVGHEWSDLGAAVLYSSLISYLLYIVVLNVIAISLFSISVTLFCKWVHLYYFF